MSRTMLVVLAIAAMGAMVGCGCEKQAAAPQPVAPAPAKAAPAPAVPAKAAPAPAAPAAPVPVKQVTFDFDLEKAGQVPQGWTAAGGTWKVAADPTAPSKGQVISQTAASPSTDYNVVLAGDSKLKDVDITLKLRPMSGRGDQGGGPMWRATDARNYYVARWNPLEGNYRLYKVVDGTRTQLATTNVATVPTGWHTMRVTMQGDAVTCWFDGREVLSAKDATFAAAGKVGLWTKGDAATNFDDFSVTGR